MNQEMQSLPDQNILLLYIFHQIHYNIHIWLIMMIDRVALFAAAGEQQEKLEEDECWRHKYHYCTTLGGGGPPMLVFLVIRYQLAVNAASPSLEKRSSCCFKCNGLAVNNHTLVYRGPNSFSYFQFFLFPKNEDESKEVQKIIEDFKNGMLPRYTGIWTIEQIIFTFF